PDGGCIAVISATEQAFSGPNASLNNLIYDATFDRDTLGIAGVVLPDNGQYHVPVSAALLVGKVRIRIQNSEKFQLMGARATRLNLPQLWSELSLTDLQGGTLTQVSQGQTVRFEGQVVDRPGGSPVAIDGAASVLIEDSVPRVVTPFECFDSTSYVFSAGPMYHGDVTLAGARRPARAAAACARGRRAPRRARGARGR